MKIRCVWEHNGLDSLLYAVDLPGAYSRGSDLQEAVRKMTEEVNSYLRWCNCPLSEAIEIEVVQDSACDLAIRDADSDVLFETEKQALTEEEYTKLKSLALKSAEDFLTLYQSIPDKNLCIAPQRRTFYGQVPQNAEEMYQHMKNVNAYYFGEINVEVDNDGTIVACRRRGFEALEKMPRFLENPVIEGSYGEDWTLRKMLRRFIWHDRIHAKAMYRRTVKAFGPGVVPDVFRFEIP